MGELVRFPVEMTNELPAPAIPRSYVGWHEQERAAGAGIVYVIRFSPAVAPRVTKLRHHVKHSPDGFNWGYLGSGPAELARSLLIDYFGGLKPHPILYQAFKEDIIADLDDLPGRWWLHGEQIRAWLAAWRSLEPDTDWCERDTR